MNIIVLQNNGEANRKNFFSKRIKASHSVSFTSFLCTICTCGSLKRQFLIESDSVFSFCFLLFNHKIAQSYFRQSHFSQINLFMLQQLHSVVWLRSDTPLPFPWFCAKP